VSYLSLSGEGFVKHSTVDLFYERMVTNEPGFGLIVTMRMNLVVGASSFILLASAGGCSRSKTYTSSDGSVTVKQEGKDASSMTFTGKNGEKVAINLNGGKVPDDYPKDVPLYEGTKVVMANSTTEKHTQHLVLESSDPADKIVEYYKKGLDSNGWKVEGTMSMGEMNMFTASKENRQLVVQISNSSGKRSISQILSDK